MSDPVNYWIEEQLAALDASEQVLCCIDENQIALPRSLARSSLTLISNRWDLAEAARANGFNSQFSDFDCSGIADTSLDALVYRVSKEKAVVHHILNETWRCLKLGGQLYITGYKNEGTKTYIEKIAALMGDDKKIEKQGSAYCAQITKNKEFTEKKSLSVALLLDDDDYTKLRPIAAESGLAMLSKPGLFGWNKIDTGSALLIDSLRKNKEVFIKENTHCLDLGCGYGYLSLAASQLDGEKKIGQWTLTDNNAAALIAARTNMQSHQLQAQIIASDAGRQLNSRFQLILCNPPFHQGFHVQGDLTDKFLNSAKKLLAPQGVALFVVNRFIPLERKAEALFRHSKLLASDGRFNVIELS